MSKADVGRDGSNADPMLAFTQGISGSLLPPLDGRPRQGGPTNDGKRNAAILSVAAKELPAVRFEFPKGDTRLGVTERAFNSDRSKPA